MVGFWLTGDLSLSLAPTKNRGISPWAIGFAWVLLYSSLVFAEQSLPAQDLFLASESEYLTDYYPQQRLSCSWFTEIPSIFTKLYPDYKLRERGNNSGTSAPNTAGAESLLFTATENPFAAVRIEYLLDSEPNAFAVSFRQNDNNESVIYLSHGITAQLSSRSEMAFVLAHEMSHLIANHYRPSFPAALLTPRQLNHITAVHQDWEMQADMSALHTLRLSGFNTKAPAALLRKLNKFETQTADNFNIRHPRPEKRIAALAQGLAHLE